jgi:signal peptidase I
MKRVGKFGSMAIVVFLLGFAVGRYERTERQQKAVFGIAESMKSIATVQRSDLRSVAMRPGVYVNRFIGRDGDILAMRDGTVYERVGQGIRQRQ